MLTTQDGRPACLCCSGVLPARGPCSLPCRLVCVWDLDAQPADDAPPAPKRPRSATPQQLLFQHAGHRAAVSHRTRAVHRVAVPRCPAAAPCACALGCARVSLPALHPVPHPPDPPHPRHPPAPTPRPPTPQVVDLQWNPADPWTLLSVADEAGEGGGGTLHVWRVTDLVYRPADEVWRGARGLIAAG